VPPASTPEHVPGGNPTIAVPGQTPPFPVRAVAPLLVRVVAASAANVLAAPSTTGSARFSTTGAARGRELNWAVMRARTASLLAPNIVNFIAMKFSW
jgi:hypothetical protein